MDANDDFVVTRKDYEQGMGEMVANIVEMQQRVNFLTKALQALERAHNTLAEVCGCHRYILEKFVPKPMLEAAVTEFAKLRAEAIEQERLAASGIPAANSGN